MRLRHVIKRSIPKRLFAAVEPWGHLAEAVFWNCLYGFPARGMHVIGVTGTNGKTTTSFLIHRMLTESGRGAGLMTTVAWAVGDDVRPQHEHMTNVPVPLLVKRLRAMRKAGVQWLVLETTSHALVQYRTWGVRYSVAVLTNITHEHLDYHKTFEQYVAAKRRLFEKVQANRQGLRLGVVNADDPSGAAFARVTQRSICYGLSEGDVRAVNVRLGADGVQFDAVADGKTYKIQSGLPGSFNVHNILAAVSVGHALNLSKKQIEQGIAALPSVAGRMQAVDAGQKFAVIVDYAHTPDAIENVLQSLRETCKGKLLLVFGATGDRDKTKREPMGEVAGRLADKIFLTDDETYTESGHEIRLAVYKGIETVGATGKTTVIADRREAIAAAVAAARPSDVVVLTGIGHQDSRMMGGREIAWSEEAVVRKAIAELHAHKK